MVMDDKLLQFKKQYSPKLVTELGMVMEDKLLQPEKQRFPIPVTKKDSSSTTTLSGIMMDDVVESQSITSAVCNAKFSLYISGDTLTSSVRFWISYSFQGPVS